MARAEELYRKMEDDLSQYKGKIVAIDEESGDYFIGDDELEAYHKAHKKHPSNKFVFKRIGFKTTYFVGAF
ncbi:MAG TPA: hypothetical protein VJH22_05635 [Candidatus Nanoarchaeia archaeon]|nr:hypothetical protein [Candidatus Nanoarchaeia archaeon]